MTEGKLQWHVAFAATLKIELYQEMMDVVTRANWEKLEEEREMCEALKELFAEDFREATELGKEIGKEIGKKETSLNLKNMGMKLEDIAKAVGETVETVETVESWLENME